MSQVSRALEWKGIRVRALEPADAAVVMLTGRSYAVPIRIEATETQAQRGRLVFTWLLEGQTSTPLTATYDVGSAGAAEFLIPGWVPTRTGYAELRIHLFPPQSDATLQSTLEGPVEGFGRVALRGADRSYTLFSSSVRDSAEWESGLVWQREQRTRSDALIVLAAVAAAAAVATLLVLVLK